MGQRVACGGNTYALHAELNWVPVNLCVPVPEGTLSRACRLHHRRRHRHAGVPAGGGPAGRDGLRGRPGPGGAAPRADSARRRASKSSAWTSTRAVRPRGATRRLGFGRPRPGLAACDAVTHRGGDGWSRLRLCLPLRRRWGQRPCSPRRRIGPRPRAGRGHRQGAARSPLEGVLREGARCAVLALVWSGSVRSTVRGGRGGLPDRLRPLDRAPEHGVLRRPGGVPCGKSCTTGRPHCAFRAGRERLREYPDRVDPGCRNPVQVPHPTGSESKRRRSSTSTVCRAPRGCQPPRRGPHRGDRMRELRVEHAPAAPEEPSGCRAKRGRDTLEPIGGERGEAAWIRACVDRPPTAPGRRVRGRRAGAYQARKPRGARV